MFVRSLPRVLLLALLWGLLAFSGSAFAQVLDYTQGPDGKWRPTMTARQIADWQRAQGDRPTAGATPGSVKITARGLVPVGNTAAQVALAREATARAVARAAWRAAAGPWGAVAVAAGSAAWCKYTSNTWTCDERQDPAPIGSSVCLSGGHTRNNVVIWKQNNPGAVPLCAPSLQSLAGALDAKLAAATRCDAGGCVYGKLISNTTVVIRSCYWFPGAPVPMNPDTCPTKVDTPYQTYSGDPVPQCPAVVDFSDPAYSSPGGPPDADGKCPTGRYSRPSEDDFSWRWEKNNPPTIWPDVADDVFKHPGPSNDDLFGPGDLTGPGSVPKPGGGTTTTTTSPGGTTTTTQQGVQYNITYEGDSYHYTETTTTITNAPGGTTTTTTTQPPEVKVCGIPGSPPCKIDESGTPTQPAVNSAADVDGALGTLKTCLLSPSTCLPALPSLSWSFAFPTACSPIPLPAFAPYMPSVDVCGFMPTFHALMTMVWAACGVFGAVNLVGRDSVGS